ncbi:MAG: organomercurial lyase, partial [Rhodothermales bacterium]
MGRIKKQRDRPVGAWDALASTLTELMGPEAETKESASFVIHAASLLTRGHPVPLKHMEQVPGRPLDQIEETLQFLLQWNEVELNGDGHIVGIAGLSLNPTRHRFHVAGRVLYTWCAVDALFFPTILGRTAGV